MFRVRCVHCDCRSAAQAAVCEGCGARLGTARSRPAARVQGVAPTGRGRAVVLAVLLGLFGLSAYASRWYVSPSASVYDDPSIIQHSISGRITRDGAAAEPATLVGAQPSVSSFAASASDAPAPASLSAVPPFAAVPDGPDSPALPAVPDGASVPEAVAVPDTATGPAGAELATASVGAAPAVAARLDEPPAGCSHAVAAIGLCSDRAPVGGR